MRLTNHSMSHCCLSYRTSVASPGESSSHCPLIRSLSLSQITKVGVYMAGQLDKFTNLTELRLSTMRTAPPAGVVCPSITRISVGPQAKLGFSDALRLVRGVAMLAPQLHTLYVTLTSVGDLSELKEALIFLAARGVESVTILCRDAALIRSLNTLPTMQVIATQMEIIK